MRRASDTFDYDSGDSWSQEMGEESASPELAMFTSDGGRQLPSRGDQRRSRSAEGATRAVGICSAAISQQPGRLRGRTVPRYRPESPGPVVLCFPRIESAIQSIGRAHFCMFSAPQAVPRFDIHRSTQFRSCMHSWWTIRSMSRTRVKIECQNSFRRQMMKSSTLGARAAPRAAQPWGRGAVRKGGMPRRKGHTRGAGKHATGQRKGAGASLWVVERNHSSRVDLQTAPMQAPTTALRGRGAPNQGRGRYFGGLGRPGSRPTHPQRAPPKSLSILLWAPRFLALHAKSA